MRRGRRGSHFVRLLKPRRQVQAHIYVDQFESASVLSWSPGHTPYTTSKKDREHKNKQYIKAVIHLVLHTPKRIVKCQKSLLHLIGV